MLQAQLPALCVLLPLLACPLCLLLRGANAAWGIALLATAAMLLCVVFMAAGGSSTVLEYSFGNWEAPYGISYRLDALSLPLLFLIAVVATVVLLYARGHSKHEIAPGKLHLFYLASMLHLCGLAGVISTGDIFNMFVFIEIASLSSYALLAMGPRRDALKAAFRYLIQGSIGATFILIGIGYLYAMTGTLNMADMAARLMELDANHTVRMAYGFLTVGFAIKFALFPLHAWLPGAYRFAPAAVAALFAATGSKIYMAAWMRISFMLFNQPGESYLHWLAPMLMVAAALAIITGTVRAFRHQHLRGVLANSSLAHIGYMVLGIASGGVAGIAACLATMYAHALLKCTMFMAAGRLQLQAGGSDRLQDLRGLGRSMPWTMATIIVAGLGLVGAPLTVGFISKWQLGTAFVANGDWALLLVLLLGSLGAAMYIYRIISILLDKVEVVNEVSADAPKQDALGLSVMLLLAAMAVIFGIDASVPLQWATEAATLLLAAA